MRMKGRRRAARIAFALALSVLCALVFCENNTPLGPSIGSDNAMYLTMGTALAQGYAPYTQIFDHKGPLLFVLQTLPQLAGGYRTATVFAMEALFLFASLLVVDALCARAGARCAWAAQAAYLAAMMPCLNGGNLTEEYANLFTLAGLLLALRAFSGEEQKKLLWPAAGMGALAMAAFLTRANNALPLLGAAFGLTLFLAASRAWGRLLTCAGGFALGCALALAPVALWLASRGALGAAFYGAIVHNMMYSAAQGGSRVAMLLTPAYGGRALAMAALAVLGALACLLSTRRAAVPLAAFFGALGAGAAAFISHKFYLHYLMLGAPTAALGAALLLAALERRKPSISRAAALLLALACGVALLTSARQANASRLADREDLAQFTADAQALYAQVPEEDRDAFMAYRVEPRWYVVTKALPCMRFYFLQEILAQVDPRVMDEIVRTFETAPPRWLVIFYDRPFEPPYDPRVAEIFETRYTFVDAQGKYQLLRLKDEYRPA